MTTPLALVTPGDLGPGFDIGGINANKITVNKSTIGLPNVVDLAPADYPVSAAQATAIAVVRAVADSAYNGLAGKVATTALTAHTTDTANPHGVTKAQVGLGNADNTSDASKPVSAAIAAALGYKLSAISPEQYGAVGDGVTDDTNAVQSFLTALRDGGIGKWGGTYSIREGVLILQPSSGAADTVGPLIFGSPKFLGRGVADAAYLKIYNADYNGSGGGKFYRSGQFVGGVSFAPTASAAGAVATHGLELRGTMAWSFSAIEAKSLRGSAVYVPVATVAGNGDFYEVGGCSTDTMSVEGLLGVAIHNANTAFGGGFSVLKSIRGQNGAGISKNTGGQGTTINGASFGCSGWAYTYASTSNSANRQTFTGAELDTVENGFDLQKVFGLTVTKTRFVCRMQSDNVTVWPRTALKFGSNNAADNISDSKFEITLRIEPGCTKAGLGTLIDFQNSFNISNVDVDITVIDNAGLGLVASDVIKNVRTTIAARVIFNGVVYYDGLTPRRNARARVAQGASVAVTNGGFAGQSNKVPFSSVRSDPTAAWDATNNVYKVTSGTGLLAFKACISINAMLTTRIQMGIMRTRAGVDSLVAAKYHWSNSANVVAYEFERITEGWLPGDTAWLALAVNNAAIVSGANIAHVYENYMIVEAA